MALLKTNTGIGTTNPTSALHVIGDVLVTGVVTSTTFNGNINSGVGTIVNLTNTRLTSGVGTITTFNSNTATILDIDNLRMLSGIATITQINATTIVSTNNDFDHLNANFGNIDVGIVTNISGTRLNYTGVGTITTLNSTNSTLTNLNNERLASGIATVTDLINTRLTSGIATITDLNVTNSTFNNLNVINLNAVTGVVTDIFGSRLNYTGVGTITTLNSTHTNLTNINSTGISTLADIRAERVTVTGIVTANSFRPTSGYIQAADGTNSFYIYDTTGNVAFQGTIGVNQINNAGGFQVLTFNNLDTRLTGNLDIAGVTTSSVFNGNIYSLGVSTFRNGPVLIGTGTSTGTAFQPLQVTGGAYVSDNLGLGLISPTSKLDVVGDGRFTGVVTATTFNGDINAGVSTLGIATAINLTSQQLIVSGLSTFIGVTTFQNDVYVSGDLYVTDDLVFDEFTGRNINVTGVATIFNLVGTAATITTFNNTTSTITDLSNTRLTSGIATITDLNVTNSTFNNLNTTNLNAVTGVVTTISGTNVTYTNSDFINLNANNAFVDVGIVTDISGTRLTYTGVGTITTLDTDTATINNLSSDYINVGVATANILNSGIGTITDLNNTRLVSGIATITDLNVTNSTFTNLNATNLNAVIGVVTDISGTRLNYTGVGTITTLDTDTADINNLTSNYINVGVATASIFNTGIGTITDLNNTRLVSGIATITTLNATNVVSTNSNFTNLNANNAYINVGVVTDISGTRLNYTGVGTIATLDTTNATIDDISNTNITVSGIATIQNLDVLGDFDVFDSTATFHNNVFIAGNLSIGGTTTILLAEDLFVIDKTIVLGITTDSLNVDIANDDTANGGGISIASTEGNPLVSLQAVGVNSLPNTHKKLLWSKAGTYGVGTTDAFLFNYAVGIGSTLVPNNVRLAVGNVQITDNQIDAVTGEFDRLISGIATFTGADISNLHSNDFFSQSGIITDLSGTRLNYTGFGTITNLYSADAYIDDIASNVGFATAFIAERLNVTGVGTIATLNSTTSTITNLNVTNSSFTNVNVNNLYAVTGIVTTLTSAHSTLENINSSGISTLNIVRTNTINSSGVVTAPTFVGDLLGVANYAHVSGYSTFSGYSDTTGFSTFSGYSNAAGVSTFADYANNAGIATYAWTAGVSTYSGVAGYSTFSGYSDTTGFSTFSGYANAAGVSTFADYANNAGIATYAWTAGVSTYSGVAGYSTFSGYSDTTGFSTFSGYSNTSGFSTFSGYSNTSGFSTFSNYSDTSGFSTFSGYANNAGIATYAWTAGVSTYSGVAGVSTSVVGGNADVSQLNVSGITTLGFATVSSLYVTGFTTIGQVQINPSGIITSASPGIATVVYYGDGSNLIGVNAFNVINQPLTTDTVYPTFATNAGVASVGISSAQVAYIPSSNRLGIGSTNPNYTLEIVGDTRVSGLTSVTNLEIYGTVGAGNTLGNDGQYLKSTGVGVTWSSFPTLRTTGITTAIYGQKVFSFSYNVGFLDVYVNGVKLTSSEYTATNGSSVTLVSAAFENDIVEFVSYNTLSTGSGGGGGGGGPTSLDDLTDVILTNPQVGELLGFDGTYWINDYTFTTTTATVSQVPIHTISSNDYRSIEYIIQVTNGINYHLTKILVLHDGTTAYNTEYGTLSTGPVLATFDTDISGGAIRLLATPYSSSTMTYKIKFTAIKA